MNPCIDCPKKGCGAYHDICPEHQAMKQERAEINRMRLLQNNATAISIDHEKKYRKKVLKK